MSFEAKFDSLCRDVMDSGQPVETHWQATRDVPQNQTLELMNVPFCYDMPWNEFEARDDINPTLPWAEDHFQERVSRIPHNPPPSAAYWQRGKGVDEHRDADGKFSHTYPERFWPKHAGDREGALDEWNQASPTGFDRMGIRYEYGDLDDVVSLLAREPYTRQAYLPVWFPEDTGAVPGERVPCTLGYHFLLREGKLHTFYPIRSCDLLRHFRNDVYLAVRLTQWVLEQLVARGGPNDKPLHPKSKGANVWNSVRPGTLTMHIVSLHVFEADLPGLEYKYGS